MKESLEIWTAEKKLNKEDRAWICNAWVLGYAFCPRNSEDLESALLVYHSSVKDDRRLTAYISGTCRSDITCVW